MIFIYYAAMTSDTPSSFLSCNNFRQSEQSVTIKLRTTELGEVNNQEQHLVYCVASLDPRPFPPPVFDRLQYTNMEGEGQGWSHAVMSGRHMGGRCLTVIIPFSVELSLAL